MFLASPITFPNLGITVDPSPVAFTVFGKDIYWYGIIIACGLLLAVRVDEAAWGGQRRPRCLCALSPTPLSDGGGYHALVGGEHP